jgi:hypothetical protein
MPVVQFHPSHTTGQVELLNALAYQFARKGHTRCAALCFLI